MIFACSQLLIAERKQAYGKCESNNLSSSASFFFSGALTLENCNHDEEQDNDDHYDDYDVDYDGDDDDDKDDDDSAD